MKIELQGTIAHLSRCTNEETDTPTGWIFVGTDVDGAVVADRPKDLRAIQSGHMGFELRAPFGEQLKLGNRLYIKISTDVS